ncbi:patatin family protein [uncultured Robinsoniella sp.]|uniref:patatin-like phospholipase family protein n=1 Tax=uncultured Robinsoniella sp. TaxID=904190 RepID=UPI00374FD426
MKDSAIILEGGSVRGVFSSGALDYLMEKDCYIPHVIGVSAGSCNAVDYVSRQIGRTRDCIVRSNDHEKLISIKGFLKNKSLFNMELLFEKDPSEYHPFDFDTFFASHMTCEIVVTNCLTGKAEYLTEKKDGARLMMLCRASSSLPIVSPMVEIDGVPYLDGGLSDSIPILHSLQIGNKKNVVILTRNKGYRKTMSKRSMHFYAAYFKKYPQLVRAVCLRPYHYNRILAQVEKWEEEGKIFVVRPQGKTVSRVESDKKVLNDFYRHGYEQMEAQYEDLLRFLEK